MAEGIALLARDDRARLAFEAADESVARAARRRAGNDKAPVWRPFQLAFILINLMGLTDKGHDDREIVDLLLSPTGGGRSGGLSWPRGLHHRAPPPRRIRSAEHGVAVIMRYTLRLLTLDQLGRAAGVICAGRRRPSTSRRSR